MSTARRKEEWTKDTVSSIPYSSFLPIWNPHSQSPVLPFEPTIFPKLQVNFADFPYLRSAIRPEASYLGDLMRLSVRRRLKMRNLRTASRHFSRDRMNSHCIFVPQKRFLRPLSKDTNWSYFWFRPIIQASKDYFSQQMKLHSLCHPEGGFESPSRILCFYAEKKTLLWVHPAVMTFVQVAFTYPESLLWNRFYSVPQHGARRKGILTFFLFSNFGEIRFWWNLPFLTNLDLLQGRLTRC